MPFPAKDSPTGSSLTPAPPQPVQTRSIDEAADAARLLHSGDRASDSAEHSSGEEPKGMPLDLFSPVSSAFEF